MSLFKEGDIALKVSYPRFNGVRGFATVEIGKVHKTGRLTLLNDKAQWSLAKGFRDEPDFFTLASRDAYGNTRLYPMCKEVVAEIMAERSAHRDHVKLRKIGEALSRVRCVEEAGALWESMPQLFKDLILEKDCV
jgi:hypothetical protein